MTDYPSDFQESDISRSAEDVTLTKALMDVALPDGLESRLLAAMPIADAPAVHLSTELHLSTEPGERGRAKVWSRRTWLSSAAGFAGLAFMGRYLYVQRPLGEVEVEDGVKAALVSGEWVVPWLPMAESPAGIPLPKSLRMPRGWQYVETVWGEETPAFDLTVPGGAPSVLFAIRLPRGLAGFSPVPPTTPNGASGDWRLAMWRSGPVLYVLASQGSDREFRSLFLSAGAPPLV